MRAEKFIGNLEVCAPSREELCSVGLTAEEACKFREGFFAQRRVEEADLIGELGEVGRLYSLYDVSDITVGMLHFEKFPSENLSGWNIGYVESDPIVVNKLSQEVQIVDQGNAEIVLWSVSQDCACMLAALVPAACFLAQCAVNERLWEDVAKAQLVVNQCVNAAGGEKYRSFYSMLLGV